MTIPLATRSNQDSTSPYVPVLTGVGRTDAGESRSEVFADEHWVNKHWRPVAGWVYLGICICDFLVFPILWSLIQAKYGVVTMMWQPLTLLGGGLFHLSFGTLLGITSYGRTREKIAGVSGLK